MWLALPLFAAIAIASAGFAAGQWWEYASLREQRAAIFMGTARNIGEGFAHKHECSESHKQ